MIHNTYKNNKHKNILPDKLISELSKYLIDPYESSCINYNTINIFRHPVYQIFFWKNESDNTFFSLYKYFDKYITIYDRNVYELFNEDVDEDILNEIIVYLFKHIKIHENIDDISLEKYKNDVLTEIFIKFTDELKSLM